MDSETTKRLLNTLPNATNLFIMYGATEASARLSYVPPSQLPEKIGSIGIPIPGVELRILRKNGDEVGIDEVGEIEDFFNLIERSSISSTMKIERIHSCLLVRRKREYRTVGLSLRHGRRTHTKTARHG